MLCSRSRIARIISDNNWDGIGNVLLPSFLIVFKKGLDKYVYICYTIVVVRRGGRVVEDAALEML